MMVTIAWRTKRFHVVADLPKGLKFNATYYTTEIFPHISEWRRTHGTVGTRKLIVHADNARLHTARSSTDFLEANGMKRAPHPPYSPDLAPSDFYLFGDVKRRLSGCVFNGRDELLSALEGILWGLKKSTLITVFREYMPRLRICIETKGEYIS
jgi:histone-lysine N-methyltransferase SETMAR